MSWELGFKFDKRIDRVSVPRKDEQRARTEEGRLGG